MNSQVTLQSLQEDSPLHKAPLTCRIYSSKDGKPLKTLVAQKFPLLSRRERRALLRTADKLQRQKEKSNVS